MKAKTAVLLIVLSMFLAGCIKSGVTGNAVAAPKSSCTDSDGGKDLENFGIVKAYDSNGNSYEIKDRCVGNIYLIEGYCEGDQGKTENFVCKRFCDPFDNVCF